MSGRPLTFEPTDPNVDGYFPSYVYTDCREIPVVMAAQDTEARLRPAPPLSLEPEVRPAPLAALRLKQGMPTDFHFVRSHFGVPLIDHSRVALDLGGAVKRELHLSLRELLGRPSRSLTVVLECAGHRRKEFSPATAGLPWSTGAVSEARWTGVPLADLLAEVQPSARVCEVLFEGCDRGLHRSASDEVPFSRSIPFERARHGDVLIAWEMNGAPIPPELGGPVRAIVPGCYAVDSVKWLRRIEVRERPFLGPFQAQDYRLIGVNGRASGEAVHELRISSLILEPEAGAVVTSDRVEVSGVAWAGHDGVAGVEVRLRGGSWRPAMLAPQTERYGFTHWSDTIAAPPGNHEIEARAVDQSGNVQPERPEWNVFGYANNSIHRIPISIAITSRGRGG